MCIVIVVTIMASAWVLQKVGPLSEKTLSVLIIPYTLYGIRISAFSLRGETPGNEKTSPNRLIPQHYSQYLSCK